MSMDKFRILVEKEISKVVKQPFQLEVPQDPKHGDFALPCFLFAKELKKNPAMIAQELAGKIKPKGVIRNVVALGAYVNVYLDPTLVSEEIIGTILKEKKSFGAQKPKKKETIRKETIVLEYPSPNTNKPLHLGHLRNMFYSKSVQNLLTFAGHKTITTNLNNDRGVHICKSMLAYKKFANGTKPDKKPDHFVGDMYVLFNEKLKDFPDLEKEAQVMLQRWEENDAEIRKLWKLMNAWALQGFSETYARLGMKFDRVFNESEFYDKGKMVVEEGLKKGIFEKQEDGSVKVLLEKHGLPDKIILRADGTSIYITQDMYLAKLKQELFKFDKSLTVTAIEQILHFQQLKKILELLGYAWAKNYEHLSYGMVNLPTGRMKSREGTVVDADDLLDEVENLALQEIAKRHKELPEKEMKQRATQIGVGALKFFILKMDPQKDMTYHPEESLSFEGETGPYVQYAHARICSILRKHGKALPKNIDTAKLTHDLEQNIVRKLGEFPSVIDAATRAYKPSIVCHYLLAVSQLFNEYYHQVQILQADEETKIARLALATAVQTVLANGLMLLEIEAPQEM